MSINASLCKIRIFQGTIDGFPFFCTGCDCGHYVFVEILTIITWATFRSCVIYVCTYTNAELLCLLYLQWYSHSCKPMWIIENNQNTFYCHQLSFRVQMRERGNIPSYHWFELDTLTPHLDCHQIRSHRLGQFDLLNNYTDHREVAYMHWFHGLMFRVINRW